MFAQQVRSRSSGVDLEISLHRSFIFIAAVVFSGCSGGTSYRPASIATPTPAATLGPTTLKTVISVPNIGPAPGFDFDAGTVDPTRALYFNTDRTNKSVDFIDIRTNQLLAQVGGFVGQKTSNAVSGPNVVAVVQNQLWASDGDSTVKVIDISSRTVTAVLKTNGLKRADNVIYDPDDNVVLVANKNETTPFVTFFNASTQAIVGTLQIPSTQLDGALYDPVQKKFLIAATATTANPGGEIDVIDPKAFTASARFGVTGCLPGGLAVSPSERLLVGCSGDAIAAGFPAQSLILDAVSGRLLATITQVGGSDQVTFSPSLNRFYLAARDMTSNGMASGTKTPVLGVIDAVSLNWIENVPTSPSSKGVAVDPTTNHVFVPLTASPGPGVGVYGPANLPQIGVPGIVEPAAAVQLRLGARHLETVVAIEPNND